MNLNCPPKNQFAGPWLSWLGVVLYLFLCSPARAEMEERWLLVFDTSAEMKKRLPGVAATVKNFLETSGGGQIHPGDSVGVWTFCRELHAGKFPLTTWKPERSAMTISNLVKFVSHEGFAGDTSLDALLPTLGKVIASSDRLTVLIFCDGTSQIDWTPYDNGINQTFQQNFAERKKARQPFVLLLRTQQGKFTGCTVNFPPGEIKVPAFPAWPEPPRPVVKLPPPMPAPAPPQPPAVSVPALIIVGTHVGTNLDDVEKIAAAATNPVSTKAVASIPVTDPPPPTPVAKPAPEPMPPPTPPPPMAVVSAVKSPAPVPTNIFKPAPIAPVVQAVKSAASPHPARAMPPPANRNDANRLRWLPGGGGLLALAFLVWLVACSRRPRNSLITDSLNAPKGSRRKK